MSAITKEMVFEAAAALVAAGMAPKVAAVREKLGKGSFTTINEYMREWRDGQKMPEAPTKEAAPQAITERLMEFGSGMWSVAMELATESMKEEREALEQLKKDMDDEQRETVAFADNLSNEVDFLRAKVDELQGLLEIERTAHESTRNLYTATTDEFIKYRAELDASKHRLEDFKSQTARLQDLHDRAEDENKEHLKREIEREGKIARLESDIERCKDEMKHQVDVLMHELESERKKLAKAEKASETDRTTAQAAQIEVAKLQGELEGLRAMSVKQKQTKVIEKGKDGEGEGGAMK